MILTRSPIRRTLPSTKKCTPSARLFFAQGPKASVFICLVRVGGGVCDRYLVQNGSVRLQRREADCILPAT